MSWSPATWIAIGLLTLAASAGAQPAPPATPPPADDIPLEVVPLVDKNAPLAVVWFSESPDVPLPDAGAAESQVFEDIAKRMDLRVYSRDKTLKLVDETGDPALMYCKWQTDCLLAIGRLSEADRVIGVKMSGGGDEYYLAFKRLDLDSEPLTKATRMTSGSLSKLLMSGIAEALADLLQAPGKPLSTAPVAVGPAANAEAPAPKIAAAPLPKSEATQPAAPPPAPRAEIVPETPRDEVPDRPERPGFFRRHLGSTIALGASLVAAGVGIGLGVMASNAQNDVEFQYDPVRDQSGRDNALAANVLFAAAGAAAVTAVILFFFEPGADQAGVTVQPAGAGALVRF